MDESQANQEKLDDGGVERLKKSRRTRWGQTAPVGDIDESTKNIAPSHISSSPLQPSSNITSDVLISVASRAAAARAALEKAKKALESQKLLKDQIATFRASQTVVTPGLPNNVPVQNGFILPGHNGHVLPYGGAGAVQFRPPPIPRTRPLRFDQFGRELDDEGRVVEIRPTVHSTLKVNINKEREARLKQASQMIHSKAFSDTSHSDWFDPTLVSKSKGRKKGLCFVEKGFYAKKERQMFHRLQAESLGIDISQKGKEEKKEKAAEEEAKFQRLLEYTEAEVMGDDKRKMKGGRKVENEDKEGRDSDDDNNNNDDSNRGRIKEEKRKKGDLADGDDDNEEEGDGDKKDDDDSDDGEEFNPNLIPLGGGGVGGRASYGMYNNRDDDDEEEHEEKERGDGSPSLSPILLNNNNMESLSTSSSNILVNNSHNDGLSSSSTSSSSRNNKSISLRDLQKRQQGLIPEVEWWDACLLKKRDPSEAGDGSFPYIILEQTISNLIEHPVPIAASLPSNTSVTPVMYLTPKERAKLRRRKRQEKERDKQDKIRMGLLAPPPPKVKLSNLLRVLGDTAVADPSKIEKQVRQQMAKRIKDHEERNESRKVDAETRRQKKVEKWMTPGDGVTGEGGGCRVVVFYIKDLSNRKNLFKVDKNAQQLHITGAAIISPDAGSLVVAEGTNRALKAYKKLLLRRIKWGEGEEGVELREEAEARDADNGDSDDNEEPPTVLVGKGSALCRLMWEGVVKEKSFKQWKVYVCKSESEAKKLLSDRQADHYWDMMKKFRDPAQDL